MIDIHSIPLDDEKVWDMICDGNVKGCFQIEGHLGRKWCKEIKPRSIEELSDVIALIRPGCLNAFHDGKNMTQHYSDRKNNKEEVQYDHPSLETVLKKSFGIMIYQENSIDVCRNIAGFTDEESDTLRRGISKKKPEVVASLRVAFIEGCDKVSKIDKETASRIFDNIEASNRYSFNKCWSKDTTVETDKGDQIRLDEVKIGDKIKSPKNLVEDDFTNVKKIYHNGKKKVYQVKTSSGKIIKCTLDHKLLCDDMKLRTLSEIISGKYMIMCQS